MDVVRPLRPRTPGGAMRSNAPGGTAPSEAPGGTAPSNAPGPDGKPSPTAAVDAGGRPGGDRLDELTERLRATGAVDRDEVAAFLEESGITDQVARGRYREPDVFALAERVHARLCVRPSGSRHAAAPVRWDWRGLLRPPLLGIRLVAAAALTGTAWWSGAIALLPVLIGVPLAELLVAWHQGHVWWGLISYDSTLAWRRHLRALGWATLAVLVPPLLVGAAMVGAALAGGGGLTHPLPAATGAGLLALASGVLVTGGYAVLLVLAARRRLLAGTVLFAACGLSVVLSHPAPVRVALVGAGYLAGLVIAAHAMFDPDTSAS
jgi:hypothetical protein